MSKTKPTPSVWLHSFVLLELENAGKAIEKLCVTVTIILMLWIAEAWAGFTVAFFNGFLSQRW